MIWIRFEWRNEQWTTPSMLCNFSLYSPLKTIYWILNFVNQLELLLNLELCIIKLYTPNICIASVVVMIALIRLYCGGSQACANTHLNTTDCSNTIHIWKNCYVPTILWRNRISSIIYLNIIIFQVNFKHR